MSVFDSAKKVVIGDIAHDAADSGNPIKVGGKANTQKPTAVANADRVQAWLNEYGVLMVNTPLVDTYATSGAVSGAADMQKATAISGTYAAVVTGDLDGSSWAASHAAHYYRLPMVGWSSVSLNVYNNLGVTVNLALYMALSAGTSVSSQAFTLINQTQSVATGNIIMFGPKAAGPLPDSDYVCVPALENPMASLILMVDPTSAPSSGEIRIYAARR